jgi:hypothetical protein
MMGSLGGRKRRSEGDDRVSSILGFLFVEVNIEGVFQEGWEVGSFCW